VGDAADIDLKAIPCAPSVRQRVDAASEARP
jgi:hypothetical protein